MTTGEPNADLAQQIVKASRELDRLHGLLIDAINSLMHHFSKVSELSDGQRDLLAQAIAALAEQSRGAASEDAAEYAKLAAGYASEIAHHLNGALTALQFQDMSSQLINHIRERVTGMSDILQNVARPDTPAREHAWDGRMFGPVNQEKVRGGSVELF